MLSLRGPAALLPALAACLVPTAAGAGDQHVWVAAEPRTWNAVPNARDMIHGTTLRPHADDVPHRRLPALHEELEAAGAALLRAPRGRGRHPRAADPGARRRRAADPLQEPRHADRPAALDALPRRRVRADVGRHLPAAALRARAASSSRGSRSRTSSPPGAARRASGRTTTTRSSMEDSIAGGMFGALSIAGRARAARPTASTSSRSPRGTASRRSTGARSSATRRCSGRASARRSSGT